MITPDRNDSATVTIRVDGIALEQDETFQLRLVANSLPQGIFCLDTLDVVIEDGNGIIVCMAIHMITLVHCTHHNIHACTMMHIIIIYSLCM